MTRDGSARLPSSGLERDRLTLLTYGMAIAFGFGVAAMGPAMPLLRDDLGISRTVGGLHFTALASGSVIAGLTVERAVRRLGRAGVFWRGGAGMAAGAALIGVGWQPAVTLLGALLVGFFGSAALVVAQATLSDHHPTRRAVALTEVNIAMSLGSVAPALVIGALVAVGMGWRPALLVPALVVPALAVILHDEVIPAASPSAASKRNQRVPSAYWLFWAAFIPAVGAEWCLGAWGAGYLVDIAEASEAQASVLMTAFFGAMVIGRVIGGRLARRIGAFTLLVGATATGLAGFLLFWGSQSTFPVVIGLLVAGLGISMQFPMLLTLAIETAPDLVEAATARVSIAAGSSVLAAPLLLGFLADNSGIRTAFGIVPGLFILVVLFALVGRRFS